MTWGLNPVIELAIFYFWLVAGCAVTLFGLWLEAHLVSRRSLAIIIGGMMLLAATAFYLYPALYALPPKFAESQILRERDGARTLNEKLRRELFDVRLRADAEIALLKQLAEKDRANSAQAQRVIDQSRNIIARINTALELANRHPPTNKPAFPSQEPVSTDLDATIKGTQSAIALLVDEFAHATSMLNKTSAKLESAQEYNKQLMGKLSRSNAVTDKLLASIGQAHEHLQGLLCVDTRYDQAAPVSLPNQKTQEFFDDKAANEFLQSIRNYRCSLQSGTASNPTLFNDLAAAIIGDDLYRFHNTKGGIKVEGFDGLYYSVRATGNITPFLFSDGAYTFDASQEAQARSILQRLEKNLQPSLATGLNIFVVGSANDTQFRASKVLDPSPLTIYVHEQISENVYSKTPTPVTLRDQFGNAELPLLRANYLVSYIKTHYPTLNPSILAGKIAKGSMPNLRSANLVVNFNLAQKP